jgi:solute:Na+ symporter, SSS family
MIEEIKHVNLLDWAVIIGYLLMLTGVGIYLTRFNKTVDDFFKGGGKIPWWISGLSTFVAGFSAFMFVAAAGYTYKNGAGAVVLFTSAVWGYGLGYLIYAALWRRSRLSSPMEFLTRRFSQHTTYYYTLLSIVPAIMGLGLGIYILCIFFASALGLMSLSFTVGFLHLTGLEMSMIVTGVVMLIYTSAGGLWAVVITDALQFFIILVVSLLVFPLSFMALGGDGGMVHGVQRLLAEAPPGYLSLSDVFTRPAFYLAYLVSTLIGYNAAWHIGQRYYSVPTERDARKMAILCAVLSLILPFLWIVPTMVARLLWPDIGTLWPQLTEPAEASYVTLALTLLPNGLIGLTVTAILAATMTHTDTQLNYLASILVRDVYVRLKTEGFHKAPGEREQLIIGRIAVFTLGILAIVTAIIVQRSKGVFDFALMYYSWFAPSMLMPVMLGFLVKKTPSWSAIASATAGLVVVMITNVFIDVRPYQYEVNIFGGVGVASLVFFLSMFFRETDAKAPERQDKFAEDLSRPANAEDVGWAPNALTSYRIVGLLTAAIGITVVGLALVPTTPQVRYLSVALGLGTAGLGGLMVWFFHRETNKQQRRAMHKGDAS